MRFGLALPQYDYSLGEPLVWPAVVEWAQRAEALGFSSVWLSDHLFYDLSRYGGPQGEQKGMECFTGLAALAGATSKVRLGTLVVCNDLRNPALVAKMAATIDILSGGRMDLGVGAGWFEAEYHAAGIPFDPAKVRVDRMAEALQIIRGLLRTGQVSFEGEHYRMEEARSFPLPVQAPLPVFVGGQGDRVARIAGRLADGFNSAWAWEPDDFADRLDLVDRAAAKAGRRPNDVRKTVGLYALPARNEPELAARWERYRACSPPGRPELASFPLWARDKLAGTHDQIAEIVRRFEAAGVSEIILTFGSIPFQICDPEAVTEFVEEIVPLVV